jgi:hypothetical protein
VPALNGDFHVRVLDANNCIELSDTVSYLLGISDGLIGNDFQIYPNPTDKQVWVSCTNTGARPSTIELVDLTGRVIFRRDWEYGSVNEIGLSTIANGQYMLRVFGENTHFTRKITVAH